MEHHRAPPMMSNGGHGGPQHHHPQQHQQQQPSSQGPNDYDDIQARLGYMSMNELAAANGVVLNGSNSNSSNGVGGGLPNDYSHHPSQQPSHPQQRPSQQPSSNVIYYGNIASQPTALSYQQQLQQQQQQHHQQQQQQQQANRSLNPRAAVFVPRGFAPQQQPTSVPMSYRPTGQTNGNGIPVHYQNGSSRQVMNNMNGHPQQAPPSQQSQANGNGNGQYDLDNEIEDYLALSYLKEFIYVISNKPAMLNVGGLHEITNIVNSYLEEDDCVLELVVNQLVDQSIVDVNFRYSGVKICMHFMDNIREVPAGSFETLLVKRIQRECSRKVAPNTANTVAHMNGLAFFIADLFSQSKSQPLASQFAEALPNLLLNLLGSIPKFLDDNCKCVTQVLKLCGGELDELFSRKDSKEFENIITKLAELSNRDSLAENVKEMIRNTLKARENNWVSQAPKQWSSDVSATATTNTKDGSSSSSAHGMPPGMQQAQHTAQMYGDYYDGSDDFESGMYYPQMMGGGYDFGNGDEDNQEICDDFENFLMGLPQQ